MELDLEDVPGVPARTLRELKKARITKYKHIMFSKSKFVMALTGLTAQEVENLYATCAAFCGARARPVSDPEIRPPDAIATGELYFDQAIGGGLRPGTVTVVYGTTWKGAVRHAYGSGTTQCALMLASGALREDRGTVHIAVGPTSGTNARMRLEAMLMKRLSPDRAQRAIRDRALFLAAADNEMVTRLAEVLRNDIKTARMLAGHTYARHAEAEGGGMLGLLASSAVVVVDGLGKTLRPAVVCPRSDRWKGTTATTQVLTALRLLAVEAEVAVVIAGRGPGRTWKHHADRTLCVRKYCWSKSCTYEREMRPHGWESKCEHRIVRCTRKDGKRDYAPMLITERGFEDDTEVADNWKKNPTRKTLPPRRRRYKYSVRRGDFYSVH